MLTKEEVLQKIERRIKEMENSINMFTTTVGEIVLMNDGKDHKVVISDLARSIKKYKGEIKKLIAVLNGDYNINLLKGLDFPDDFIEALIPEYCEEEKEKNKLPEGVVGQISGFDIHQPIMERNFLIRFPQEFGIIESDVRSYFASREYLHVYIRNNVTCPLIVLTKLDYNAKYTIAITTLDVTGNPLYDVEFIVDKMDEPKISGGDYSNNEPQVISLRFHVESFKIIDKR